MGRGHNPLPRPFPQLGGGYPLPMSHPTQRLRHLDPSHSKILGKPLSLKCSHKSHGVWNEITGVFRNLKMRTHFRCMPTLSKVFKF